MIGSLIRYFVLLFIIQASFGNLSLAQSNEDCMMCHEDTDLETERQGRIKSLFVNQDLFDKSVHNDIECVICHQDAEVEEFPHPEILEPVDCGMCHDDSQEQFELGIHKF